MRIRRTIMKDEGWEIVKRGEGKGERKWRCGGRGRGEEKRRRRNITNDYCRGKL